MTLRRIIRCRACHTRCWDRVRQPLPLRAQDTQGPIAPKPGATVQKAPENAIRVRVALVNAPVTVHDAKGELVLDLQKKDFHVLDNGVEQNDRIVRPGRGAALGRAGV